MPFSVELIRKLERVEPELREVLLALLEEVERQREESVTKKEFLEFARQTEENFQRVWKAIDELRKTVKELAEAQKETDQTVKELAEAQKETDQTVKELAEAQKETDQTVKELAEAQKRTEEAQRRTEEELRKLTAEHRKTRKMLGGLSDTVGYGLEDRAMKGLPQLFKERYSIEVKGRLVRKFVKYNGKYDEINIFGEGIRRRKRLYIIGEAKARLSRSHVDDLIKLVKRLEKNGVISGDRFLFMVTYSARPEAEEYAREKGVEVIWSFEI